MRYLHHLRATRRTLWRIGLWCAMLVFVWLLASFLFVYASTRRPHAHFAEPAPSVPWGILEDRQLDTDDGETLGAWFHRGADDACSVIVLHGVGGSRWNSLPSAEFFTGQGCS